MGIISGWRAAVDKLINSLAKLAVVPALPLSTRVRYLDIIFLLVEHLNPSSPQFLGSWSSPVNSPGMHRPVSLAHDNTEAKCSTTKRYLGFFHNGSDLLATTHISDAAIPALTIFGIPVGCSSGGTVPSEQPSVPGDPFPLSDVIYSENGLL